MTSPIENSEIKKLIEDNIENATATIEGDGYQYHATVISDTFENKNIVQRHKMIYAALNNAITGGSLHALNLKAYTSTEWDKKNES